MLAACRKGEEAARVSQVDSMGKPRVRLKTMGLGHPNDGLDVTNGDGDAWRGEVRVATDHHNLEGRRLQTADKRQNTTASSK